MGNRQQLAGGLDRVRPLPCRLRTIQLIHESIDAAERVIFDLSEFADADSAEITKALIANPDPAARKRAEQREAGSKANPSSPPAC